MDNVSKQLVDYAMNFNRRDLTDSCLEAALDHVVDTIAVGIAGTTAEASRIAARVATATRGVPGATVIGAGSGISPDMAAFANTVMVRTYDWNDGMQARGGGHPSDMIPGLLVAGEISHCSGTDFLVAAALAYELLGGLGSSVDRGCFDQGLFMGAAVAVASGRLLGLDEDELGQAASLALTTALPLGVHRWGSLSMTKGASTAFAVRNGLFSVLLARQGFTSAPEPVDGLYGLSSIVGEFEPMLPVLPGGPSVIEMSHLKAYPAESQVLGILGLIPAIRAWTPIHEVMAIEVEMSDTAHKHVADASKFDPRNRETADHSLPFILAVALLDGEVNLKSYRPERLTDRGVRELMARITVRTDDEFTRLRSVYEGVMRSHPIRITVKTRTGRVFCEELRYHKGHYRDPMTKADLKAKFAKACDGVVNESQLDDLQRVWWNLADTRDIAAPMKLLGRLEPPS